MKANKTILLAEKIFGVKAKPMTKLDKAIYKYMKVKNLKTLLVKKK